MRDFLFRKEFYESYLAVKDSPIGLAMLAMLCEYGVTGECDFNSYLQSESYRVSESELLLLRETLKFIFESVDRTDARHRKAVINGQKGGLKGGKLGGRGNKKACLEN